MGWLGLLLPEPPLRLALSLARLHPERMLDGSAASAAIADLLRAEGPYLVGRFGSMEMDLLCITTWPGAGRRRAPGSTACSTAPATASAREDGSGAGQVGHPPLTGEAFEAF